MMDELKPENLSPESSSDENPAELKTPDETPVSPGLKPGASTKNLDASVAPDKSRDAAAKKDKDKKEESASPFSVTVSMVYDGPLDLLLDLIRKQDIDIYDIPIAKITAQFLAYVEQLKATDVDTAGEFIYMASLLIHIKSKMLLPRSPIETAEGEADRSAARAGGAAAGA